MKRCVLYFGSFNPFHIGHAAVARHVAALEWVDELWFVLSPHNPLKDRNSLHDARSRWESLNRAVEKLNAGTAPKFSANDIEFHLPSPLYTIRTLEKLQEQYPDRIFSLLMGGDNLDIIEKWYRGREILERFQVLVYPRQGADTAALCKKYGAVYVAAPQIDISSTLIRDMEQKGEDTSALRF